MYSVKIDESIRRSLKKLPRKQQERLLRMAYGLGNDPRPHGSSKLSGLDLYRIRAGDYRVVYQIDDSSQAIEITIIAHRREVYRGL